MSFNKRSRRISKIRDLDADFYLNKYKDTSLIYMDGALFHIFQVSEVDTSFAIRSRRKSKLNPKKYRDA